MTNSSSTRLRQPWLLQVAGPLTAALGEDLFRTLPQTPGVYFFYDADGRLLYIGQSNNLRARIGSYRFVSRDRHPRRLARLVSRIRKVEWRNCESAAAAVELEGCLLLEHRPPFNRAGVWKGAGWWLTLTASETQWRSVISREPAADGGSIGPLNAGFRYVYPALMRWVYRMLHPSVEYWQLPAGLAAPVIPPEQCWSAGGATMCADLVHRLVTEGSLELSGPFAAVAAADGIEVDIESLPPREAFWLADLEMLREFASKRQQEFLRVQSAAAAAMAAVDEQAEPQGDQDQKTGTG